MENDPRIEKILLSTGNVNRNYIVRDIVFAAEKMTVDIFDSTIDPNQLLSKINYQLKEKAVEYGADAVINCHFNHERTFIGQDRSEEHTSELQSRFDIVCRLLL